MSVIRPIDGPHPPGKPGDVFVIEDGRIRVEGAPPEESKPYPPPKRRFVIEDGRIRVDGAPMEKSKPYPPPKRRY